LLLSTVAIALVLGTAAASAQTTRRPAEQPQTAPQAIQPQQGTNPQAGAGAQNAPMPQAQQKPQAQQNMPNAQQPAPSATTGQAAPPAQSNPPNATTGQAAPQTQPAPNAANQPQQPAAGQAQPQQGMPAQGQAQGQGTAQPGTAQGTASGAAGNANAQPNANTNANANGATGNTQGVITLNEQQNTRVAQAIRQANVRPLTNVSFSIAVGATIPADVQLNVMPMELVEIVPQYRGYSFVVVEHEALVIDPGTRAIVAVVPIEARQTTGANQAAPPPPREPAQAAAPPPPREHSKKSEQTRDQREPPRRQVERHRKHERSEKSVTIEERRSTTGAGPRVGDRVPDSAVIERGPVEVYRDEPPVRREHHPSVRDIPLIGPLFGPRDED
jgi:hypothetical protein